MDCNFDTSIIRWIKSYLQCRKQFVKLKNVHSKLINVSSGIPQGSVLGPYLFSLVVGSLELANESCNLFKYADDLTLCACLFKESSNDHVRIVHEHLMKWMYSNHLSVNVKKCKALCFKKKVYCQPVILRDIQLVNELKLLGVIFDENLCFSSFFDTVTRRASRLLYLICVMKSFLNKNELLLMYNGIVRPILEYVSALFVGITQENEKKLERLQKRFHRLLCDPLKLCRAMHFTSFSEDNFDITKAFCSS